MQSCSPQTTDEPLTRRRFVQGSVLLALCAKLNLAAAQPALAAQKTAQAIPELHGNEFDLVIDYSPVNFTGKLCVATTVNGSLPAPTLHWREGETVTIRVTNKLSEPTSIHWHGIILPNAMDGVPGVTFAGIEPNTTFTYRFKVQQAGTYWYHSHSGFQPQTGLYGAIVIAPAQPENHAVQGDHVMLLSDWTDEDPMRLLQKLRLQSDYYNEARPTLQDFIRDAKQHGLSDAIEARKMWNEMRMSPTDFADVSGKTYTYLLNGASPQANATVLFKAGDKIRLRLINGAAQSYFDVRIPDLKLTVIASDGQDVVPVTVDELRIGPGETYDVLIAPSEVAYTVFAQSLDRSAYARATLATAENLQAAVPKMDAPQWLNMDDMMGDMDERHAVRHKPSEYTPNNDMRVDTPRRNLDDAGVNLRDNGRRVLTYADLRSVLPQADTRAPSREIELHLTGNMGRYVWSIDGVTFANSQPIPFKLGERLRVVLVNDTMMLHPFHLHGMWSDVEDEQGEFLVRKHTVTVQPSQRVCYRVTADARGHWAWHCHLDYHMEAGMFRVVEVS